MDATAQGRRFGPARRSPMVRHKVADLPTRPDLARVGPTTPTRARRPLRASVDPTEARIAPALQI